MSGNIGPKGGISDNEGKHWTKKGNIGQRREIMERGGKYRKVIGIIG